MLGQIQLLGNCVHLLFYIPPRTWPLCPSLLRPTIHVATASISSSASHHAHLHYVHLLFCIPPRTPPLCPSLLHPPYTILPWPRSSPARQEGQQYPAVTEPPAQLVVAPWQSLWVPPSTMGRVPRTGFAFTSRQWVETPAHQLHFGAELLAHGAAGDLGQVGWSSSMAPSAVPIM